MFARMIRQILNARRNARRLEILRNRELLAALIGPDNGPRIAEIATPAPQGDDDFRDGLTTRRIIDTSIDPDFPAVCRFDPRDCTI